MIIHNIDGVLLPYDPTWKNIAVSISGGADSTLLSYLVCDLIEKYKAQTIVHHISHVRMWKTRPWQESDARVIHVELTKRFPNVVFSKRHVNFIAPDIEYGNIGAIVKDEYGKYVSGDNAQIRAFSEYVCHKENVDAYYNGVTRNPRGIDLGGMKERDIEPNESNKHLEMMEHMGRWALHPFRFTEKSWVVKQYRKLGIMDLFDLTRSCEGEFEGIDYKNYISGDTVPTCGKCFWCKEREWAIEQSK